MKRVSFKVAKALKEVGYPQGETNEVYVTKDIDEFEEGELVETYCTTWAGGNVIDAPLAFEVWLWLWRKKEIKIFVEPRQKVCVYIKAGFYALPKELVQVFDDPEEAIIAAIEYLVDNDLIK